LFADKINHTKGRKAASRSERRNIATFRTFSEQEKSRGHAAMSHFQEKDRPGTKDSEKRPMQKELEISTGTNGVISLGYSEKKEDFVLTFRQQTDQTITQSYGHHRRIEEGAARTVKKANAPQNAITSFKQKDSFAAAAMRFQRSDSSERTAKQYESILSHQEGRNTAASKVIGRVRKKKDEERQLSKQLTEMKKARQANGKKTAEEWALESRLASLRQEIQVDERMNQKVRLEIRKTVDSVKKKKEKRTDQGQADWFVGFLKRKLLEEEEAAAASSGEETGSKIKSSSKSSTIHK
jgi:hypothetical protein